MTPSALGSLDRLVELAASGRAMMFTGAGFSAGARDRRGMPLPRSADLTAELWQLLFDDGPPDDSTLADLCDVAFARRVELHAYLAERLSVDVDSLPDFYVPWLSAPWRRVYTLNVDDLDEAVDARFTLPRALRSVTTARELRWHSPCALDVVHLNGSIRDPAAATFSTSQYASRLVADDPLYAHLCEDLAANPFVFVGTVLDEPVFWRQLARTCEQPTVTPSSLLVTRSLPRARQLVLERLGIHWIQATVEEAAEALASIEPAPPARAEPSEAARESSGA